MIENMYPCGLNFAVQASHESVSTNETMELWSTSLRYNEQVVNILRDK